MQHTDTSLRHAILRILATCFVACTAVSAEDEWMEYEVTYSGINLGSMQLSHACSAHGNITRSIHLKSSHWLSSMGATIDDHIRSETEKTPQGLQVTVTKDVKENRHQRKESFVFWPDSGICLRTNRHLNVLERIEIPPNTQDMFALFIDLGKTLQSRTNALQQDLSLIADGKVYPLHVESNPPERIRTRAGKMPAIEVNLSSSSTKLFSKATPKRAYFATHVPLLLAAEIKTQFGTIHASLKSWKTNGIERSWALVEPVQ